MRDLFASVVLSSAQAIHPLLDRKISNAACPLKVIKRFNSHLNNSQKFTKENNFTMWYRYSHFDLLGHMNIEHMCQTIHNITTGIDQSTALKSLEGYHYY